MPIELPDPVFHARWHARDRYYYLCHTEQSEIPLFTGDQLHALAASGRDCEWTYEGDPTHAWATQCGNLFQITEGAPAENQFRFCCYCGGKIGTAHGAEGKA